MDVNVYVYFYALPLEVTAALPKAEEWKRLLMITHAFSVCLIHYCVNSTIYIVCLPFCSVV